MTVCPALSFRPADGTLMARQAVGGLGRVLGSVRPEALTWVSGWSGRRESNPHDQLGRLGLCH
jgi:hypothetical protein